SLSHAVTAAVLFSGYALNNLSGDSQVYNRSAINLTSERIRKALFVLRGIQAGNQLGAVLGQQFENGLHESYYISDSLDGDSIEMDKYIHRLRKLFPLRDASGQQVQSDAQAGEVLDGLSILDAVKNLFGQYLTPNVSLYEYMLNHLSGAQGMDGLTWGTAMPDNNPERRVLAWHIDQMAQTLDALGDLVVAESVYQISVGNTSRAAAFADMMSGAKAVADPEVILSPLKANYYTNRLVVNYDPTMINTWSTVTSPRKDLDSGFNAWLISILPSPQFVQFQIKYKDSTSTSNTVLTSTLSLADLQIEPIDLLALTKSNLTLLTGELNKRIIYSFRKTNFNAIDVEVEHAIDVSVADGLFSLDNLLPVLSQLKYLIEQSKPMTALDFVPVPGETDSAFLNASGYFTRITAAKNALSNLALSLSAAVPVQTEAQCLVGLTLLEKAFRFGLHGILPSTSRKFDPVDSDFQSEVGALLELSLVLVNDRKSETNSLLTTFNAGLTPEELLKKGQQILRTIFGGPVVCNPDITSLPAEVFDSLHPDSQLIPTGNSMAVESWLHANAQIRKTVHASLDISIWQDMTVDISPDSLVPIRWAPVQLPYVLNEPWLGLPFEEIPETTGKLSVMISSVESLSNTQINRGFKLDEWQESIPEKEITGGIAMHLNQPGVEAPQCVMVAVPVMENATWKWNLNDLTHSVLQAIDMAKYRALEPEHIGQDSSEIDLSRYEGWDPQYTPPPTVKPIQHLGKIFPANMVDLFPISSVPDNPEENPYSGTRVSMDYTINNQD
ncbi:MAG: hypothetical protein ACKVOK_10170, partial [Flavobacteriales bacterium]